jgi:hypothetical protein
MGRRNTYMLRKLGIIAVLSLIVTALAAVPALAVNPHEVPNNPIVCTEGDNAVQCAGSIAGLGTGAVIIQVDVALACETRSGSNQPGGHLQATTEPITPRGGRVNFDVTTEAADCPRGLNPVVGEEATVNVFSAATGALLFTTTVDIT